jgi:hypothetical protein
MVLANFQRVWNDYRLLKVRDSFWVVTTEENLSLIALLIIIIDSQALISEHIHWKVSNWLIHHGIEMLIAIMKTIEFIFVLARWSLELQNLIQVKLRKPIALISFFYTTISPSFFFSLILKYMYFTIIIPKMPLYWVW